MEFEIAAMPQEVCSIIPTMMKTISNCVLKLDECVFKLTEKQFSDTLNTADAVERLEEDMDALYQRGRGLLGKITSIPVGQAILLSQFLDAMETISDRCEDTCDEIRVIVISLAI